MGAMASDRTARLSASPPLFKSRFFDFFSRVHPAVPAILYVPIIAALIVLGANDGQGAVEIPLLVFAGLAIWTISEYWLHRKVFHWDPDHPIGHRLHFIIHGVHHDHPNDKLRLVMPPGASIPLAALFFGIFWLVFGLPTAYPLFAGFLVGYLIYDYMHYYLHHAVPKSPLAKRLREQHMRHHFQDHRYGFGVSSPLWDMVFRTMPRTRRG
jgi:dihydroceramide fatty acyl 2-hydroxylase